MPPIRPRIMRHHEAARRIERDILARSNAVAPDIVIDLPAIPRKFQRARIQPLHHRIEMGLVIGDQALVALVRRQDRDAGLLAVGRQAAVLLQCGAQRCGDGDTTLVVHHLQPHASVAAPRHVRPFWRAHLPRLRKRAIASPRTDHGRR